MTSTGMATHSAALEELMVLKSASWTTTKRYGN